MREAVIEKENKADVTELLSRKFSCAHKRYKMHDMYRFAPAVVVIMCMILTSSQGQILRTRYEKRDFPPSSEAQVATECRRCFNGEGYCVGHGVCCLKNNCIIGTIAAKECSGQTTQCRVPGDYKPCGTSGKCYVEGVCCEKDGCKMDDTCSSHDEKLIDLLKRLLSYEKPSSRR